MRTEEDLELIMSSDARRALELVRRSTHGQPIPAAAQALDGTPPQSRWQRLLRGSALAAVCMVIVVASMGWTYRERQRTAAEWQRIAEEKTALANELQRVVDQKTELSAKQSEWAEKVRATLTKYLKAAKQTSTQELGDAIIAARIVGEISREGMPADAELMKQYDVTRQELSQSVIRFIWPEGVPPLVLSAIAEEEGS